MLTGESSARDPSHQRVERVRAFFHREVDTISREFRYRGICADQRIIIAVIATEVGGLPTKDAMANARGMLGEIGPMQIRPETAAGLGINPSMISVPLENIRTGVRYLCALMDQWRDIRAALAAYNAGSWRHTSILLSGGIPHELEYVSKVARHARHLGLTI